MINQSHHNRCLARAPHQNVAYHHHGDFKLLGLQQTQREKASVQPSDESVDQREGPKRAGEWPALQPGFGEALAHAATFACIALFAPGLRRRLCCKGDLVQTCTPRGFHYRDD